MVQLPVKNYKESKSHLGKAKSPHCILANTLTIAKVVLSVM